MNTRPEICPECDSGRLQVEIYTDDIEHRGKKLRVEGLECCVCDACGAEIIYPDQIRRGDGLIADARRMADGFLTGEEIRAVRKKLGLTQSQAAEIFGGGTNAFSKYERGNVIQSLAMDRLVRLVARFPELLAVLAIDVGIKVGQDHTKETYEREGFLSLNDPDFRSRQAYKPPVSIGEDEWKKSA